MFERKKITINNNQIERWNHIVIIIKQYKYYDDIWIDIYKENN
jgi:hypothetical protein